MMPRRITEKTYPEFLECESLHLERQGIYEKLCAHAPRQDVLEIGCGTGLSTHYLARARKVLSLDRNPFMLEKTRSRLDNQALDVKLMRADVFDPSAQAIKAIKDFAPKGIVGWFIASHRDDIEKYTPKSTPAPEKPRKYRENVEVLLASEKICPKMVEWIHFAIRVKIPASIDERLIVKEVRDGYNARVFSRNGFRVASVKFIDWSGDESSLTYSATSDAGSIPDDMVGLTDCVTSILARRIKI